MDEYAVREARRMSFNANAADYKRGRPPYPDAVFERLRRDCGLKPGARVLDIGAAHGLATGPLLEAGAHVVAVEPGENFAELLAEDYGGDRLEILVGDFEKADLSGPFDIAVAATAMHWLDPATSTEKIGRLVRPDGWLAAWWNCFGDVNRPTVFRDLLDDVYHDLIPAETGYRNSRDHVLDTDRWRRQLTQGGYFADPSIEIIEWSQTLTAQSARDQWSTFPNIAELSPPDRDQFLTRLAAIIDDLGGHVEDPRLTVIYTAQRTRIPSESGH